MKDLTFDVILAYSLYDLFKDLSEGRKDTFKYNEEVFKVKRIGYRWEIVGETTGLKCVKLGYMGSMLDFQGCAASLQYYKRNLLVDAKDNIFQAGEAFRMYFPVKTQ